MPSIFAAFEDELSDAIDGTFGEQFEFIPMVQPNVNARPGPDHSRAVQLITAVIDDRNPGSTSFERLGSTGGGHAVKPGAPKFTASNPMLFFDSRQLMPGSNPVRLDRFRRLDNGATYEITALDQDGQGRLKAALTRVA